MQLLLQCNLQPHISYNSVLLHIQFGSNTQPGLRMFGTTYGIVITFENEMMPSDDALYLHWRRSCWVLHMWRQANMSLKPITDYGWQLVENTLTVVWYTPKNITSICNRVRLLLRGCKCVTGCTTGRCGCKKSLRKCSEGCQCRNCLNMSSALT